MTSAIDYAKLIRATYSNPMCECMRIAAHKLASIIGFSEPAANGATVRGMRVAEMILQDG